MKKIILAGIIYLFSTPIISAAAIYNFQVVEDNDPAIDLRPQLFLEVTNDGAKDMVNFTFTNVGSIYSTVTQIYFDIVPTALLEFGSVSLTESPGVDFEVDTTMPGNLPGATNISFSSDFNVDPENPAPQNGINNGTDTDHESLIISFAYSSGQVFDDIITAISLGDLRIGIHVQEVDKYDSNQDGTQGLSESYIAPPGSPVPIPASVILLGTGIAGIFGTRLRKKRR